MLGARLLQCEHLSVFHAIVGVRPSPNFDARRVHNDGAHGRIGRY